MFGLGKKDEDGKQVRIEHRGKYTRASRTGGVSVRAEKKLGPVNLTANSSKGARASIRIAHGTRAAWQNGRFQLIGRWRTGPFGVNLSKTGVSASAKNKAGTFNFLKPQYSSFKFAGVQIRGKKAAYFQLVYMIIVGTFFAVIFGVRLMIFSIWLLSLFILFTVDFVNGFTKDVRDE